VPEQNGEGLPSKETPWHAWELSAAAEALQVDVTSGLTEAEASLREARIGPNSLRERPPRPLWRMFASQFADFMILVLIAAAVVSGLVGDWKDLAAILVIVVLNAIIGLVQEYRAERAMSALKKLAAMHAIVLREGRRMRIAATGLVPGDVVLLEAGTAVPADLRLADTAHLRVDESLLTGESATVEKNWQRTSDAASPLSDRRNMAYKGTMVTYGRGRGVVVATGMKTELGRIAGLLEGTTDLKTPLQKRLSAFGKSLGMAVLGICFLIFAVGLMRGEPAVLMFLTAVSLAVAAIPEALPAVVTILLALGARKMVRHNALIRRLPAVETLGSVTYICTDKTGTLTQNRMKVVEIHAGGESTRRWGERDGEEPWTVLLRALALSNDATRGERDIVAGDPTEIALHDAAAACGYDKASLEAVRPRVLELPFDSERKRMTTVHWETDGATAYTKGAPESVVPLCVSTWTRHGAAPVDRSGILAEAARMAAGGLRVLALALRRWPHVPPHPSAATLESELTFLALVGLMDPPRDEARRAVDECRSAGITPVMVTGDHPETALAIAREVGIAGANARVVTGPELARMDAAELSRLTGEVRVYGRVDPAQKIRIVEALQTQGEFVAMTGDGVNDAPALKRADIGVAMGMAGTDVARESSSLILLDDNFATIVAAVREGRRIFDNIRKFIQYTMTSNSAEIWTIFLAPFLGLPIPLQPIHILWINLVTDGLPGLALAAEPEERGVMERPPRPPSESIFAHGLWQHMLWVGLLMAGVCLSLQAVAISGSAHWQTMVFTVLTLSQMGHVLAIRSERDSFFRQGPFSNFPLLGAVTLTFLLQLATIYVTALNPVFKTERLDGAELLVCILFSAVVFFAVEIEKWMRRRGWIYRAA
jgi:Ca2+-transporting ATPase